MPPEFQSDDAWRQEPMFFYFDESGGFAIPSETQSRYGVIGCLTVPECAVVALQQAYTDFVEGLSPEEKPNGEPKGSRLSPQSRNLLGRVIAAAPDILTHFTILDLAATKQDILRVLPSGMHKALMEQAANCIHASMRESVALLARQVANLSVAQFARLFALGQTFMASFNLSVINYVEPQHASFYEAFEFVVDKVANREQIVFDYLFRLWLPTWSLYDPILLIKEVHVPGHPLVDKYSTEEGILGKRVFCDNLEFVDSRTSWGVQLADMLANTAYQAITAPTTDTCTDMARMMRGSRGHPWNALTLFTFGERRDQVEAQHLKRFITQIEDITQYRYVSWRDAYRCPEEE